MNNIEIYNETKNTLDYSYLKKVIEKTLEIEGVSKVEFSVILVDNEYIKTINKEYRNIDSYTDVITFALEDNEVPIVSDYRLLGDIYISLDKAISQAKEYNHSLKRELSFLTVHGILHLLGYDHMNEIDEKNMFDKQEMILNECQIKRD